MTKPVSHLLGAASSLAVALWLAQPGLAQPAQITIQADQPAHKISPLLWGLFFEDINLSAVGGIYADVVRNRSFEDGDKPGHWSLVNKGAAQGEMSVSLENPMAADLVRTRNRRSLKLEARQVAAGELVGVANEGYWGVPVQAGELYDLTFGVRGGEDFKGRLTVTLESAEGKVYATETVGGVKRTWQQIKVTLKAGATDAKARLVLGVTTPGTVWFDMVSLFPRKTWKNRPNGLRPDLAEMLVGLKPAFVRFPGGCWVEGDTMREAYRWKETVGDLAERRTQWNIWQYWATHGIGYHEYLQMCEDLAAEPLFVINCGMSHKENVPMDQMGPFVQDALDAIEYANGPASSPYGALRVKNGHPAPFHLKLLEIGNENGGPAYAERYALMYKAIKARYPEITLIANDWSGVPTSAPVTTVDEHYYSTPEFFIRQEDKYDSYDRQRYQVYVGEYAVTQNTGHGSLRGAIGEAAFMIGMERNSDVVTMSSYAPLFVHLNHRRWNPDLINFDNTQAYGIPSYYVQQLFAQNRGDVVLPTRVLATAPVEQPPRKGGVGVGTWLTQAEYKDIKVEKNGQVLYASDFAAGGKEWKAAGGKWVVQEGAYRQTATNENVKTYVSGPDWSDYTLTLKARKLSGAEGFLVLAQVMNNNTYVWWNLGGWGNHQHGVEVSEGGSKTELGHRVAGRIETGRWYDIRMECRGQTLKCFLDGKLIHDVNFGTSKSLFATGSRDLATGDIIIKVVNAAAGAQEAAVRIAGAQLKGTKAPAQVLTSSDPMAENSLEQPTKVAPVKVELPVTAGTITHTFPGNSFTVIRVPAAK